MNHSSVTSSTPASYTTWTSNTTELNTRYYPPTSVNNENWVSKPVKLHFNLTLRNVTKLVGYSEKIVL